MARKMSTQPTAHAAKIFMGPSTHTDKVLPYLLAAQPGIAAPETHKPSTQRTKRKKPGRFLSRKNFACPLKTNKPLATPLSRKRLVSAYVERNSFRSYIPATLEHRNAERWNGMNSVLRRGYFCFGSFGGSRL